jgi:uncharacterized protein involved in exopolysaccharide biosynthesis
MKAETPGTNGHGNGSNGNGHGNGHGNGTNGHGHSVILSDTGRDSLTILFRQRRVVILSFIGLFVAIGIFTLLFTERYRAQMLILVEQGERANPVVSAGANGLFDNRPGTATEEQLNSEVELLRSRDLLEQVVVACGLDAKPTSFLSRLERRGPSSEERIAGAVRALANKLDIQVVRRSNIISVSYGSSDPQLAARVLKTMGDNYLKKHAAVHRQPGAVDFFQQETAQYQKGLQAADEQLVRFTQDAGVVSAPLETEAALRRQSDFEAMQGETQAAVAQAQERVRSLEAQAAKLPSRLTTQVRISDNAQLLGQLKTTLLTLELKRTELLTKFEPGYRPVQEVDTQIAQTRDAIAAAERSQWKEETTDRDPNWESVREDLTKTRADLAGLQARRTAIAQFAHAYETKARFLQGKGIEQQNLVRSAKAAEENFMLYLHKQEEARISDALDSRKILNVTIAEAATVPTLPVNSGSWYFLVSGLLASLASLGLGFGKDYLDPSLRTPHEVELALDIPVLMTMPKKKANGDGMGIHVS